ncbi:MAG TPA: hypothetical protein VG935_04955 [Patescibacteria group bacterium]|nr:hypothetical protein [Patescibacteria group bacterium]
MKVFLKQKVWIALSIFSSLCLFFYSFVQVDLGLTLTRASIFTQIQRAFQYVGYFNRPLSTYFYLGILLLLFVSYGIGLYLASKGKVQRKTVWRLIILQTIILVFAYNAFSYDLFNYIFDARILTHYHLNPYLYKALDFPGDKMLGFMHWTHRTYPYGPFWLVLTVPLSFVGLGLFLPTLVLFKLLMAGFFLVCVFYLEKILIKVSPHDALVGLVFFAFNPLVIIESLVSAHNDIVMFSLAMVSLYFLVNKRYLWSIILLLLSIGIKFATGVLLPLWLMLIFFERKKISISWLQIFPIFTATMIIPLVLATQRTTFQPWYLLYLIPFASLTPRKFWLIIPAFVLPIAALLNYVPFLFTGNWNPPIPQILNEINLFGIGISFAVIIGYWLFHKKTA